MAPPGGNPRAAALKIVRRLVDAGHVAYFAGGCVRDALLGEQPKDYDIATDARPEQVRKLFRHAQLVGEAFGVVLVHMDGWSVEVATFRTEWGYSDGRRPDHVTFTDAQHDAQRRDFTINGVFENPLATTPEQRIIDYVGGRADLAAGVVRAIGQPEARFGEDYLRMLRAVRFAARLGFEIEPITFNAIRAHAPKLAHISRERIGQEVLLMFTAAPTAAARARAATLMQDTQLDAPTLDEPHTERQPTVLTRLSHDAHYATCLVAWLLDRDHAQPGVDIAALRAFSANAGRTAVTRWRRALMLSNDQRDAMSRILTMLPDVFDWASLTLARRKRLLANDCWAQTWMLAQAVAAARDVQALPAAIGEQVAQLLAGEVAPPPLVTGDDLLALGAKAGPLFGRLLEQAYDAQLEGELATRDEALAWLKGRLDAL